MIQRVTAIAVHSGDRAAAGGAARRLRRQVRVAIAVEGYVPQQCRASPVLDCASRDVVHIPLQVGPPVGAVGASALCEVNVLALVRVVEGCLASDVTAVAVEGSTIECRAGTAHLQPGLGHAIRRGEQKKLTKDSG